MKILLFLPSYIGDVLMTTPAMRILKNVLKEAELYVVAKPYVSEVITDNPYIDKFILRDSKLNLLRKILLKKFDYVVLFRTTFFNSLCTSFCRTKFSVGIDEELSKIFLSKVVKKDFARPYRYECVFLVEQLFKHLGIKYIITTDELKKLEFYGWDRPEIKQSLQQKLIDNKIDIKKFIVLISPFATRHTKMLTSPQYISIINLLHKSIDNIEVVITGQIKNKMEKIMLDTILKHTKGKAKSICGQISLKELGLLCKISKLLISTDSGPAYIAEAVGTKTIILFTSTLPEKYGPFPQHVKYIYKPTICSPCYKNECINKTYRCVSQIEPKEVIELVKSFL